MSELVIRGSLEELREKAQRLLDIANYRSIEGWTVFQGDEEWQYDTHPELGRVCPHCESCSGLILAGDQIPTMFPYYTYNPATPFIARPRMHQPDISQYYNEECHCELVWLNADNCLKRRLHTEMEAAA